MPPCLRFILMASALTFTSWAQDVDRNLTLTAKEAVKLYIDGVLHDLPNDRNMSLTDSIPVSSTSRLLAFQVINLLPDCPGMLASMTDDHFLSNSSWKCFDISGGENWTRLGFDDSDWPNATQLRQNMVVEVGEDCDNLPHVPAISANAFWIWMDNLVEDTIHCRAYLPVCESSPCKNGATCNINAVDQCTCPSGYTGIYCETEIDECASGPCLNGASCQDLLDAFQCSCVAGYTGFRCETDVYECDSTPCRNNGTCEDNINGYECSCPANYTGYDCETKVDDCFSIPCLNSGTCMVTDSDGGYNCTCPDGFTGSNCESVVTVTLVVTADRSLISLYVDNVTYELPFSSSNNWSISDHVAIPESSTLIALRASNSFDANCSGILGSIGADFVTDSAWKCSTDNTQGWYRTDFDDSDWPQAVMYDWNTAPFLCEHRHQIPDISASANWIWTSNMTVSINCRVHLDNPCAGAPCFNGGTCSSAADGGYVCSCDPRFTGINCETDGYMQLTVTGDRALIVLYVDGVMHELDFTASVDWGLTEAILIHKNTALIAIRANYAVNTNCSGILGSVGDYFLTDTTWKCSTDNTAGWYAVGFDDSSWPNAIDHGLNSPPIFQCPYHYELPEISSNAHWIYSGNNSSPTNCRGYLP